MGGNPPSFPSAARPALRGAQKTACGWCWHAVPSWVGAR